MIIVLRPVRADVESSVLVGNAAAEIGRLERVPEFVAVQVQGYVGQFIIGEARQIGLVDEKHVHFVVPSGVSAELLLCEWS